MNCVNENMVWKTGIFSLKGLASGIKVGRSQSDMVSPITQPFARQDKTAIMTERTFIKGLLFMAGLNRKCTISTSTTFPIIISGMMPGTAFITGEAAIKKAVTGVMTAKIIPHMSPAVITVMMRQRLTMGPVIYTLSDLKNWLAIQIASMIAVIAICFAIWVSFSFFIIYSP